MPDLSSDAASYAAIASEQASSASAYASTAAAFAASATTQANAAAVSAAAASAVEASMVDNAASLAAQVGSLAAIMGNAPAAALSAAASAVTATGEAAIATTQAGNALTSAGNALTSANNAAASAILAGTYASGLTTGTVTSGPLAASISGSPGAQHLNLVLPSITLAAPTSSILGGLFSSTAPANQFATGVNTSGAITYAQPTLANLSGVATAAQVPALSALSGAVTAAQLPTPTALTIGGVQALAPYSGVVLTGVGTSGAPTVTSDAVGFRNRLLNGSFNINQRAVSGSVVLAAGAFGHDHAKAGAAGCTYTFSTSGIDTTLTITAGSLILPVESVMIEGGLYALSQAGTAQARVWQGAGYTGSGSYASAPFATSFLVSATQTNVEFSLGTVLRPQLEPFVYVTPFERRPIMVELALCQRYYWQDPTYVAATGAYPLSFPVFMRAIPTIAGGGVGFVVYNISVGMFSVYQTTAAMQTLSASAEI